MAERIWKLTEEEKNLIETYVKTFKNVTYFAKGKVFSNSDFYNVLCNNKCFTTFIKSTNDMLQKKAILNKSLLTQLSKLKERFEKSSIKDFKFGKRYVKRKTEKENEAIEYLTYCILRVK